MIDRYVRSEMKAIWSEDAKYTAWAHVERAHLATLVARGQAPEATLTSFDAALKKKNAADFLRREEETAHDVIAFVAEVGEAMGETGVHLHKGLTSSDVVDTAQALRLREGLSLVQGSLRNLRTAVARQAFAHAHTLCMGRTHGIHAEPTTFGLALASHFAELQRANSDILAATRHCSTGKLSGAVGNYSQLTPDFEAEVLGRLNLSIEPVATQVIPRDRLVRAAQALTNTARAVERLALNIRHLARTEVGEVTEPFSSKQKGSSAMPHKKNPILTENLCGLARAAAGYSHTIEQNTALWHERDISHSSAERLVLPDLFATVDFMIARAARLMENLNVRPEVMRHNLNRTGGLWASQTVLTALVEGGMARTTAYELIQKVALPISDRVAMGGVQPDEFLRACLSTAEMTATLSETQLHAATNPERFASSAAPIFRRVFGITPEDFRANSTKEITALVPALHTVHRVTVELLPDVLDTEAKTIAIDLSHRGVPSENLRQQKSFLIRTAGDACPNAIRAYAADVLQNPVMERFETEVVQ